MKTMKDIEDEFAEYYKEEKPERKRTFKDVLKSLGMSKEDFIVCCFVGVVFIIFLPFLIISCINEFNDDKYNHTYEEMYQKNAYYCDNFSIDKVTIDNKKAQYILVDKNGNSIIVEDTPIISDKNYIEYYYAWQDTFAYSKGDMVVTKFTVDGDTARSIGQTNQDVVLNEPQRSDSGLSYFILGYLLRSIMD